MEDNQYNESSKMPVVIGIGVLLIAAAFASGIYIGTSDNKGVSAVSAFFEPKASQPEDVDYRPLWEVWHLLEDKFVAASSTANITDEELVWGAIEGLVEAYGDQHTVFFPPEDAEVFESDITGNFGGVGMEIGLRENLLTVIAPLKGTPAERAGILSGDVIIRIDGESTEGITEDDAVKRIRGEKGTTVSLTIIRKGVDEWIEVDVVRDTIEIPTIETEARDDKIFVIRLFNFSAISSALFQDALREFIRSGDTKLVLDLRGNPGGFLQIATEMAGVFLPTGKVIVRENFGEDDERIHRSNGRNLFKNIDLEMVILVNQGSASASEILAGALREHGVATLIGQRTFGKGSVQELINLRDDSSVKVTVARWLTPNGVSISDGGLEPDISVEFTIEDFEEGRDPQFDAAIEYLLTGRVSTSTQEVVEEG